MSDRGGTTRGTACQRCRSRKLACDGARPCARCDASGSDCSAGVIPVRSALTRKRMDELESRVEQYHALWHELFPQTSLDSAVQRAATDGVPVVAAELRASITDPSLTSVARPSVSLLTVHDDAPGTDPSTGLLSSHSPAHPRAHQYPPTRPPSPGAPPLADAYRADIYETNARPEWHEDADAIARPLDGMGATSTDQAPNAAAPGAGYIGLSSSATLLRTIRRLVPSAATQSPFDAWLPFMLQDLPSQPALQMQTHVVHAETQPWRPPPASITRPLVESYFSQFHTLTPIVHEPTVRARMMGALPFPTHHGARVLSCMIFAMGAFDRATTADDRQGDQYYLIARDALQKALFDEGSLELVQGLAIMGNYLQRGDKPNAGYVCLGIAIRIGIALGIHVASTDPMLSPLEKEIRARLWWGLVTLEAGCCMTFGRPHGIDSTSLASLPLPRNIDDEMLTVSDTTPPTDVAHTTVYTALVVQARLARAAFRLQDRVARSQPYPSIEQIKWCVEELGRDTHLPALPEDATYAAAVAVQRWRSRDLQMIMYRPVLLSTAWTLNTLAGVSPVVVDILGSCHGLATDNLYETATFRTTHPDARRGAEWYTLYFAFQSALTLLLCNVIEPAHPNAAGWQATLRQTAGWFRTLNSMQRLGSSYASFIENTLSSLISTQSAVELLQTLGPAGGPGMPDMNLDFERYLAEIWDPDAEVNAFGRVQVDGPS